MAPVLSRQAVVAVGTLQSLAEARLEARQALEKALMDFGPI
jgi:hypothetical protein